MFFEKGFREIQMRLNSIIFLPFILLNFTGISYAASFVSLGEKIYAESRLPAYLNTQKAMIVFERIHVKETIELELTFRETQTQRVPAAPLKVVLSGASATHQEIIDISAWPDGEYKVTISEPKKQNGNDILVRGIRKQTLKSPTHPTEPISMAGIKMLFFDDWYIAHSAGIKKQVNPSEQIPIDAWQNDERYARNMTAIKEFWFDQEGTMYVKLSGKDTLEGKSLEYWVKSKDMKQWHGVDEPGVPHANKAVNLSGLKRSALRVDRQYRYYDQERDGQVDLSGVKVQWSGMQKNTKWGDVEIPFRSRLAVWEKEDGQSLILGSPITIDKHLFEPDEIGTWLDSNDNFGDLHLSPDGAVLRCYQTRLIPRHDPFRIYYDNLLCDRIMVTWSTTDGLRWTPTFFDVPTLADPSATQHYGVDVWYEEDKRLELAYHRIYDVEMQRVYTELAYSRDGLLWNRFKNGLPFLDNGTLGEWNFGYAITSGNRTRLQGSDGYYYEPMMGINVLHFMFLAAHNKDDRAFITPDYYTKRFNGRMAGEKGVQTSPIWPWYGSWEKIAEETKKQRITPGLMRYRVDGWVRALPVKRRGYLKSKLLSSNEGLHLNAKTAPDGFVMIEVLDQNGNYLSDYSGLNAARFSGDDISAELTWLRGQISHLPDNPFVLLITLEKAEIYTLQF